ncbi:MAG: S-layer homology domain-containing protein [Oscillospiraceae bacterium]|nr:S-layer homology domain-containing protein [Oscillospiraceae bacterium]
MRKIISVLVASLLVLSLASTAVPAGAVSIRASLEEVEHAMRRGLDNIVYMIREPRFGSVGGEWAVFSLARANHLVPEGYFERYLVHIGDRLDALTETSDPNSTVMHHGNAPVGNWVYNPATGRREVRMGNQAQATENVRLAVALTSLGLDASAFVSPRSGYTYDLIARLGNRHSETSPLMLGELQGINGPIWSQIAIDGRSWNAPHTVSDRDWVGGTTASNAVTPEERIEWILAVQLDDGGWDLGNHSPGVNPTLPADPDMTAMAILSLAPYYSSRGDVRAAVGRGLAVLSETQLDNGGWDAWGADNVQSAAWVIIATTVLGIDPQTDPRFVKPGGNPVTAVMRFQNPVTGAFAHPHFDDGGDDNAMATDQGTYGLIAYWRFRNYMDTLFDMGDATAWFCWEGLTVPDDSGVVGLPGKHMDIVQVGVSAPGRTFTDVQGHFNQEAVEALAARGVLNGKTEADFEPDATMTRAEFAAAVTRALGLPVRAPDIIIEDILPHAWYANYVRTAYYFDIIRGTTAESPILFDPGGTITRQEGAVMVARAASLAGIYTSLTYVEILNIVSMFGDYRTAGRWAWEALAFSYQEGILDDTEFYMEPLAAISRGEIAGMLHRLLEKARLL